MVWFPSFESQFPPRAGGAASAAGLNTRVDPVSTQRSRPIADGAEAHTGNGAGSTRRSTARWTPVNPSTAETGAMPKLLRWARRGALGLAVLVLAAVAAGASY